MEPSDDTCHIDLKSYIANSKTPLSHLPDKLIVMSTVKATGIRTMIINGIPLIILPSLAIRSVVSVTQSPLIARTALITSPLTRLLLTSQYEFEASEISLRLS